MKPKIHKDCIIYFHLPNNATEILEESTYKIFGDNIGQRIEMIAKNFDESNILTEHFYKVIPISKKRVNYRPSSI